MYLVTIISWPCNSVRYYHRRGRPFVYSPTIILRCFMVRIWFRLDSNRSLHHFLCLDLPYNRRIMKACGLSVSCLPPSRRTFDKRLKIMSVDIKERITTMGNLSVFDEGLIKPHILAVDSTLLRSKGKIWHVLSKRKGVVPCSGIDTDAMWGFNHTRGWIFGYKLHMVCNTDPSSAIVLWPQISQQPIYPIIRSIPI